MRERFEHVAGVDPSMTSTGVAVGFNPAVWPADPWKLDRVQSKPDQWASGPKDGKGKRTTLWRDRYLRMENVADRVAMLVPDRSLVFLEAPSYGSDGAGTWDRAGLWWMIYEVLAVTGQCEVVPVTPAQRMIYATGTGRASKDSVLSAVVKRYAQLDVTGNDVADAVVFAAMAARAAGWPLEESLPQSHLRAMDKLAPAIERAWAA